MSIYPILALIALCVMFVGIVYEIKKHTNSKLLP